jgi:2-polyprenyl-3-methyl-5-hydroxy-6-metoxy-1,4-benzoquinol methylase
VTPTKILVAIASYGAGNDRYLAQIIKEYRAMPFHVDLIVLSNIPRELGPDVEVIVGLPSKNPWSLPFGHKQIFADRLESYDLFIYSEDDILITERNIRAFLAASEVLPEDEIAGFFRFEIGPTGQIHLPDVLGAFHWDPNSVRVRVCQTFAFFTNEHAAAYILTREQLRRAIASGGFLLAPHEGRYDMLVSAATDPYTRCGMKKLICISQMENFLVHHLSNKYVGNGRFGVAQSEFHRQIDALLQLGQRKDTAAAGLFTTETRLPEMRYSKVFYEPAKTEILSLIPEGAKDVLSVGCGWGVMEASLVQKGMRVVGIPLDPVIGACAAARGVEIVAEHFESARAKLADQKFDVLLVSNVLHLVANPSEILSLFASLLRKDAVAIIVVPNLASLMARRRLLGEAPLLAQQSYEKIGVQHTSKRTVGRWIRDAGLRLETTVRIVSRRAEKMSRATLRLLDPILAQEIIISARKP